jgi:uncharacterized protein YbaP (TraB family)
VRIEPKTRQILSEGNLGLNQSRLKVLLSLTTGLMALAIGMPAASQTAPPATPPPVAASDGESAVVQQLEVIGRRPGPALWRVTHGDSQVVVIGGLSPLPHVLQWNEIRVQRAFDDATVLFLPPDKPHVGLFDAAGMLFRLGALRPPHGEDMEASLAPALRARFERVRDSLHLDPKKYQHWKPAVAGLLMVGDFRRVAGLSSDKPATTIARIAKAAHAEVRTVGAMDAKPLFDAAARMSDAQNQVCLSAALDDIEYESAHSQVAAAAWAVGDLKAVRANAVAPILDECLTQLPSIQSLIEKGTRDAIVTINQALARPGKSVALIDLTFLLRRNGVLDRLKAEGVEITLPP